MLNLSSNILKNAFHRTIRNQKTVMGILGNRYCSNEPPPIVEKTINAVSLLGRVGSEPQRRGNDEHPIVIFSMATHQNYRSEKGDWSQRTDWHRIVVFKPQLRELVMKYLRKGQRTMVQGKISYGEITDAEGKSRISTSIIADDVIFLTASQPAQNLERE